MSKEELNKQNAILILAGRLGSVSCFNSYEYFLNIGNSLAIDKILNSIEITNKFKSYIAVSKIDEKFAAFKPFKNIELINVGLTCGVIETIRKSLSFISEENIFIIPITTIPDQKKMIKNVCYFSDLSLPKENWSAIQIGKNNNYKYFFKHDESSFAKESFPFTGRISAQRDHLIKAIENFPNYKTDDMLYLVQKLIEDFKYKILFEKWLDIGHKATYHNTRIESFTSRFFNNITYKKENNTIIKRSENQEKISCEINFYNQLPLRLKTFFPYIFAENKILQEANNIEIEYIPYPNLAELFLFNDIGPNGWLRVIRSISKAYKEFYSKGFQITESNCSWLYSDKLTLRFSSIENYINKSDNLILKKILFDGISINNKLKIKSLYSTFFSLKKFLINYERSVKQYIGHGDLCFNNILIDHVSGTLKLIDPKAFHDYELDIFGLMDPNYDLSKLNHSFKYLYDSVVNNLFSIEYSKLNVNLKIFSPKNYDYINMQFENLLIANSIDKELLRILTANLFISMLPLHIDDEEKLIALAIIGSILFDNLNFNNLRIDL